ncbi:MAG: nuclear transport factor 2 family protein [Limnohabitans sp.]|nr:nuclear transport factor 2 family protein [Limnohabitans sp.]
MDERLANAFARDWIEAWNAHDLDRVLSHYTDDFEMCSPMISQLFAGSGGRLRGKDLVRGYWCRALEIVPDLRFELITLLVGVQSVTIYYQGARDRLSAEVFYFDASGKVTQAVAHYAA